LPTSPLRIPNEIATFIFNKFDIERLPLQFLGPLRGHDGLEKLLKLVLLREARATKRSELFRRVWQGTQKKYENSQPIFLDESVANEGTGDRKFGQSPIGLECGVFKLIKRSMG
jgi:hypothetical protein